MTQATKQKPDILVVEDHLETAATIELYLENVGCCPLVLHDGIGALKAIEEIDFDLIILDIMLPGLDGRSLLERLRESSDIPVILLTALGTENQRLEGFNLGADDYVVKPFSPKELVARVKARLRNKAAQHSNILSEGPLKLYPEERRVICGNKPFALTPTEFDILATMMASPRRVFTRGDLIARVFGYDHEGDEKTISTHVYNLRSALEAVMPGRALVHTVFGVGYRFDAKDNSA